MSDPMCRTEEREHVRRELAHTRDLLAALPAKLEADDVTRFLYLMR